MRRLRLEIQWIVVGVGVGEVVFVVDEKIVVISEKLRG